MHDLAEAYQKLAKTFHYKDNYVAVNEHAGSDLGIIDENADIFRAEAVRQCEQHTQDTF